MERLDYVDVARGLGIFITVLGHCLVFGGFGSSNLFWYIYSFHMPFWFMISGFLYKKKDDPYRYITRKVTSLLIPYISYFALNMVIYLMLICIGKPRLYSSCCFGAFWFLITLFLITTIHYILDVLLFSKSSKGRILQYILSIIALLLGLNYARYISDQPNQPIATAFVGYAFFTLGYSLKGLNIKIPQKQWSRIVCFIAGLILSTLLFFTSKKNGSNNIDMNTSRYMNEAIFLANSLIGIASFVLLSVAIQKNAILQNMGRNSLTILMIHIPLCKMFLNVCAHFGYQGSIPVTFAVIISLSASYCAIWLFNKYLPFMMGKLKFE